MVEPCCACDEAKYEVIFEGIWYSFFNETWKAKPFWLNKYYIVHNWNDLDLWPCFVVSSTSGLVTPIRKISPKTNGGLSSQNSLAQVTVSTTRKPFFRSFFLSLFLSFLLSFFLSFYLSLSLSRSFLRSFFLSTAVLEIILNI